ncbi:aromatic acid exporter family protein [Umezawaea endophytica]|uniref:Aromatic acid exporter family protein n=1 Tax=Umezawaea endophytica TaxID=1654476 RepID=A0A9X3AF91_9PSEU|nr:aromatic acid exporter family protein [Umezawaea endophytica]MCS7478442.1 aromatic acid exporter family protein [Umezawaea endophytica]
MTRHAVVQAVKCALVAVLAWLLADRVLGLPQPFLAPYAAVLMIESTVYRSVKGSVQQVAATASAVLLAFVVSRIVPDTAAALGVAVLTGVLLGRWSVFGEGGRWIGVTAVLVLTTSGATDGVLLVDRLLETALGVALGTVVNALVLPPTYSRWAGSATSDLVRELRGVLTGLARALRDTETPRDPQAWVRRVRRSEHLVRRAEEAVGWSDEADHLNVRRARRDRNSHDTAEAGLREAWPRLVQITEAVRSGADSGPVDRYPGRESRAEYADLLDALADVVGEVEVRGEEFEHAVTRTRDQLKALDERVTTDPDQSPGSARGLGVMLLPARAALDALTRS